MPPPSWLSGGARKAPLPAGGDRRKHASGAISGVGGVEERRIASLTAQCSDATSSARHVARADVGGAS